MSNIGLIIDNFAGGGGASTGIEEALDRPVDVAINHDAEAVAMHKANHTATYHMCQSVWRADPRDVAKGRHVALAWFSPDCKHFSKAKGGKPVEKNIRDLAWVVVHWAKLAKPDVIMLENVEEFKDWGPLIETEDGKLMPCPLRKGFTFRRWCAELKKLGYKIEHRELRACDYGAPTIRKRLFLIARRDGKPIVWPTPTHGKGLIPYRTAAECIDWSIPCPSIFERKKPLAEATLRRIAKGIQRYVIDAKEPFIVPITHAGSDRVEPISEPLRTTTTAHRGERALVTPYLTRVAHGEVDKNGKKRGKGQHPIDEPIPTVTASPEFAIVTPTLIQMGYGEREGQQPRVLDLKKPLGTVPVGGNKFAVVSPILVGAGGPAYSGKPKDCSKPFNSQTTENHAALVTAFLAQHNTGVIGHDAREPVSTITQRGTQQAIVAAHLINMKGSTQRMSEADQPAPTQCAGGWHIGEVRAFLLKYYSTDQDPKLSDPLHSVTTKDRFGLVTVLGEEYQIVDIGMRMLTPRELYRAQGFPDSYIIDPEYKGKPLTKTSQVRMCGNSVCPPVAAALVRANFSEEYSKKRGVA